MDSTHQGQILNKFPPFLIPDLSLNAQSEEPRFIATYDLENCKRAHSGMKAHPRINNSNTKPSVICLSFGSSKNSQNNYVLIGTKDIAGLIFLHSPSATREFVRAGPAREAQKLSSTIDLPLLLRLRAPDHHPNLDHYPAPILQLPICRSLPGRPRRPS